MQQPVIGFLLLAGVLALAAWVAAWHTAQRSGTMTEGRVIGVAIAPGGYDGDKPVLTVQLKDGTTHKVFGSRTETMGCKLDSPISLVRRGASLRVGMRGCHLR